jgi:predicted permease
MITILNIIAPVFLVVAGGYLAVHKGVLSGPMIDGLMKFAVQIAVPCLLFRATSTMDLSSAYDWRLMTAFYLGATISFIFASSLAWKKFGRRPGEAIAVGFSGLFSNLVLLGLPISERAWGADNITPAYAIVSVHAPFCYLLGISAMEMLRADGRSISQTAGVVVNTMFRNSLMIGLGLGFIVNISAITLPPALTSAVDMLARAALPAALFGLGGILTRYSLKDSLAEAGMITGFSLILHPLLVFLLCKLFNVPATEMRIIVLLAAMAPGVNAYLFANMYQRGQGTAASTVLLATSLSVLSISAWLWVLGGVV